MLTVSNVRIYGWESALRGMRNPLNSWDKSDSIFSPNGDLEVLGRADLKLASVLASSGSDHGKYLRMVIACIDICAPLYWWKEFDTYKVGTVANSCSTMHTIHKSEFDLTMFSHDHLQGISLRTLCNTIDQLNYERKLYLQTKDKSFWWNMIQLLPSSFNQKRTVMLNYEVARSIYRARKGHKLDEWARLLTCFEEDLPYFEKLCLPDKYKVEVASSKEDNKVRII